MKLHAHLRKEGHNQPYCYQNTFKYVRYSPQIWTDSLNRPATDGRFVQWTSSTDSLEFGADHRAPWPEADPNSEQECPSTGPRRRRRASATLTADADVDVVSSSISHTESSVTLQGSEIEDGVEENERCKREEPTILPQFLERPNLLPEIQMSQSPGVSSSTGPSTATTTSGRP